MIAHYTFDEKNGKTAKDTSEFGVNGTVYGARWTEGRIGGALDFDGIDDYVQIPNNESHPPNNLKTNDQGSISLWFKCDYVESGYYFVFLR